MIYPHTELQFISPKIGYGVVANKLIPKGTITWASDELDQTFTRKQVEAMDEVYKDILFKYTYRDYKGDFILCWDHSRFVNHSFNSNCITTAYNFEVAVRDIYPGEELTDDYGYLNCLEPFECLPEPNTNRTHVMPDDLLYFYKEWDDKVLLAFKQFNHVQQPLAFLIETTYRKKVSSVGIGSEPMDSILNCFYSEDESKMMLKDGLLHSYSYA
ncbi:MAG: SET domain-containing protein [Bacteroidota bacterium]|nr:SET domain-containing protein [Bacteroidota bacterium]